MTTIYKLTSLNAMTKYSQALQQKEIVERPARTVAHLADACTFPHCAMLSHVELENKNKLNCFIQCEQ